MNRWSMLLFQLSSGAGWTLSVALYSRTLIFSVDPSGGDVHCHGLRRSEVCGLRWEAIDFEAGTICICHTAVMDKGRVVYSDSTKTATSNRVLPLTPSMRAYLLQVKQRQKEDKELLGDGYNDSGYVCVHPNGSPSGRTM